MISSCRAPVSWPVMRLSGCQSHLIATVPQTSDGPHLEGHVGLWGRRGQTWSYVSHRGRRYTCVSPPSCVVVTFRSVVSSSFSTDHSLVPELLSVPGVLPERDALTLPGCSCRSPAPDCTLHLPARQSSLALRPSTLSLLQHQPAGLLHHLGLCW